MSISCVCLLLVLIKFPHFWEVSKEINISSHSHILLKNNIFPKNIDAYKHLTQLTTLCIDLKYALLNNQKEIEQVFVEGKLFNVKEAKKENLNLLGETIDILVNSKSQDENAEDERVKSAVEKSLEALAVEINVNKKNYDCVYKMDMFEKNNFILSVIDESNSAFKAILLGDARDVLKNSKNMMVEGKKSPVNVIPILNMIEEFARQGIRCFAIAQSDLTKENL